MSIERIHPDEAIQSERLRNRAADGLLQLVAQSGDAVAASQEQNFSAERFLEDIEEPMAKRADAFGQLLEYARIAGNKMYDMVVKGTTASSEERMLTETSQLTYQKGPHIDSRRIERHIARSIEPKVKSTILAFIVEARMEAAGRSTEYLYLNPAAVQKENAKHGVGTPPSKLFKGGKIDLDLKYKSDEAAEKSGTDKAWLEGIESSVVHANNLTESEEMMWQGLARNLTTVDTAKQFTDWVSGLDKGNEEEVAPLLEMLAVDLHDDISAKRLEEILESVYASNAKAVRKSFVMQAMQGTSEFSKQLRSWAGVFSGSEEKAIKRMLKNSATWNQEVQNAYASYRQSEIRQLLQTISQKSKSRFYKYQQLPSPQRAVNGVASARLQGRGIDTGSRKKRAGGRVTPSTTAANSELIVPQPNMLRLLDMHQSDMWYDTDPEIESENIDAMVTTFIADYPHEKKLKADIEAMLESVRARPYGEGTTPLKDLYFSDGIRLRRLNPIHQKGLPTATEIAKDSRVLYAVKRQQDGSSHIGIVGVYRHGDYDRVVNSWI